jgi:hypothetical protein
VHKNARSDNNIIFTCNETFGLAHNERRELQNDSHRLLKPCMTSQLPFMVRLYGLCTAPRISLNLCCKYGQDRQCTYNVTLRSFRENTLAVEKQQLSLLSVCLCALGFLLWRACPRSSALALASDACSLVYPACKAHVPYFVIFGLSGSTIFSDVV